MSTYHWTALRFQYFDQKFHTWRQVYKVLWQNLLTSHLTLEWLNEMRVSNTTFFVSSKWLFKAYIAAFYVVPASSNAWKCPVHLASEVVMPSFVNHCLYQIHSSKIQNFVSNYAIWANYFHPGFWNLQLQ